MFRLPKDPYLSLETLYQDLKDAEDGVSNIRYIEPENDQITNRSSVILENLLSGS